MAHKTKLQRGYYPIRVKDIRRYIGYCNTWGYGNKDTCKYVAENIIEQLTLNSPEITIKDSLYSDIVSFTHDINNGASYKNRELLISIN